MYDKSQPEWLLIIDSKKNIEMKESENFHLTKSLEC
jgi:hypothetical protein